MIPYGRQTLDEDDIVAVTAVLRGDWLTQGPTISAFEKKLCDYTQASHAVATANGTAALHAVCAALELGPQDTLWTSPISFVASANCARYLGARVDFVDIDPVTRNIDVRALREKLITARNHHCLPKIVAAVHFAGLPCDMQALAALAAEFDFYLIEDAAHAVGSEYQNSPVGSCQYSTATCLSFHPVKNITTGEGGAVLTQDAALAKKIRQFCSHGITRLATDFIHDEAGAWRYEQQSLGFNYRITDIQAALGISQLLKLPLFIQKRQAIVDYYHKTLADLPLKLPSAPEAQTIAWHLYVVELLDASQRLSVFNQLRAANIGVNVHYYPIHLQPYYRQLGFKVGNFPVAEHYYAGAITLPLFPELQEADLENIVKTLRAVLCV